MSTNLNQPIYQINDPSNIVTTTIEQKIQPQPYPLQGQSLPTGWGQYPQGAFYPPPVQKSLDIIQPGHTELLMTSVPITTSTTTQYVEVQDVANSSYLTGTNVLPMTTSNVLTSNVLPLGTTTMPLASTFVSSGYGSSGVLGPNTYGVPENFPVLPCDAGCHKCHGTGFKKTLVTRKWKACKRCASKYGTDVSRLNLYDLPPIQSHLRHEGYQTGTTGYGTTYATTGAVGGSTILGTNTTGSYMTAPNVIYETTNAPIIGTTGYTTSNLLPAGFQTLPANPQCVKCQGVGYRKSKRLGNQWKGCRVCAGQYGTDLSQIIIPSSTMTSMPVYTSTTGTIGGTNIIY